VVPCKLRLPFHENKIGFHIVKFNVTIGENLCQI
jgi:hypothetical protein